MISRAIQWHDYSRNTLVFLFNIVNVVMVYDGKVKQKHPNQAPSR